MTTVITDNRRYTEGDCHILARALSKRLGLPICTFTDEMGRPDKHAFIQLPDGRCLDVEGLVEEAEFRRRWYCPTTQIKRFDTYEDLVTADERWEGPYFGPKNYSYLRAHNLAERLVREHAVC